MGNPLARKREGLAQCVQRLLMGWTTRIWFLARFVYRMGTGSIKPVRDTDKLSEMKMREDTTPYCQMI